MMHLTYRWQATLVVAAGLPLDVFEPTGQDLVELLPVKSAFQVADAFALLVRGNLAAAGGEESGDRELV